MKKFSVLLVIILLFTGFSTAQIQMESLDLDSPQIWTSPDGPHMIIRIDTIDFELVGLSEIDTIANAATWTYNIDRSWIKKISTLSNSEELKKNGYAGVKGVTIITLYQAKERVFLLNQGLVDKPLKIKKYN